MEITQEFRQKVLAALLEARQNSDASDGLFANQYRIHASIFSRMKNGETEGVLDNVKWIMIGRRLGVATDERKWNVARTDVFCNIEREVKFCQKHAKARVFVDDCGIGKTFTAKQLSRTLKNCFYVDASQAKSKQQFIRLLARTLGVDHKGRCFDVRDSVLYCLSALPNPIIIIDEAGDLDYPAFLELKAFWNATEGSCGWFMIGADGLRTKIESGIHSRRVGFREIFSRFSEKYASAVPVGKEERVAFYKKLITDVLTANTPDKTTVPMIVKKCLIQKDGNIGGLRRAESLLIAHSENC